MYLAVALVGCWCWQQMFFWLPKGSLARHLSWAPGWALLLSPGPAAGDNNLLAPAFIGALLGILTKNTESMMASLVWMAGGLVVALIIAIAFHYLIAPNKQRKHSGGSEQDGQHADSRPTGATLQQASDRNFSARPAPARRPQASRV